MGRKPLTLTLDNPPTGGEIPTLPALTDAVNRVAAMESAQEQTVRALATTLGYQLPADSTHPDIICRDIAVNVRRAGEACLEIGKGLRVLKEACKHGEFIQRLDGLGIERKVAARFMQAAVKFCQGPNVAAPRLLKAATNQSKLFELLVLDDEVIEELELTGESGELKLDDIATMSQKELRTALREAQEDAKAKARLLAEKGEKIDELATKLTRKQAEVPPPDQALKDARQEVTVAQFDAETAIRGRLAKAIEALAAHGEASGMDHTEYLTGAVAIIQTALDQLREQFGLPERVESIPAWLNQPLKA